MMRPRRVRRASFAAALVAGALVFGACSSGGTPELSGEQANDPELVTGRAIFQSRCARCHGGDGGGGAGPKLKDGNVVEHFPDPAQQEEVVRKGRGSMPSFDGALTDEEITAVVRFTREVL